MNITLKQSLLLTTLAMLCLYPHEYVIAQSEVSGPAFRARTDVNAEQDLQRLREELSKAIDANGPVNPLGRFLQRNAEANGSVRKNENAELARLEIGPAEEDREALQSPKVDSSVSRRQIAAETSNTKSPRMIGVLPGPRYTIIQQASPQVRVVDGFRPARFVADVEATVRPSLQYPVTLASANLPIVGQPTSVIANYQDIPFGATPMVPPPFAVGGFNPGGFSSGGLPAAAPNIMPNIIPNNNGAIMPNTGNASPVLPPDATILPSFPYNANPSPLNSPGPAPVYSTPIPNGNLPPTYVPNPTNILPSQPIYPTAPVVAPGYINGAPLGNSMGNGLPSYSRSSPVVNGAPFVSGPPCQFDARYMVSREVYRQSVDPCAPSRGSPYAPYATPPGGSPFSYVPPTGIAYTNNGYDSGYRQLLGFGQTLNNAHLGRGIIGQPTAYVDGQPVRNFLRYIFP